MSDASGLYCGEFQSSSSVDGFGCVSLGGSCGCLSVRCWSDVGLSSVVELVELLSMLPVGLSVLPIVELLVKLLGEVLVRLVDELAA